MTSSSNEPEPASSRRERSSGRDRATRSADQLSIDLGQGVLLAKSEVEWRFSASGGPGGQHVNTSNTKAEAVLDVEQTSLPGWAKHRLTERIGPIVTVTASDTRSQSRNRDLALDRLADRLREGLKPPPPPRRATKPSKAAKARRLDDKRRRGDVKEQRRKPASDD